MTLVMLLGLSLVWGGVVVVAAALLQRFGLSGRMRQTMWRAAGVMMAAPFIAAGVYALIGPSVIDPIWTYGEGGAPDIPVVLKELPEDTVTQVATGKSGFSISWEMALSGLLAIGWLIRAVMARRASMDLQQVTDESAPIKSVVVLRSAEKWTQKLGLKSTPDLRLMSGDFSPFVRGVFKPTVYLPNGLERCLSPKAMDMVIGHELTHVKRQDAMWRPLERAVADIFWFNPFAWCVRKELDRARELACDEAMLSYDAPANDYARASGVGGAVCGWFAQSGASGCNVPVQL